MKDLNLNKTITISKDEFMKAVAKECAKAKTSYFPITGMTIAAVGAILTTSLFDGEDEEGSEQC